MKIGFIGAGNMGGAMLRGILKSGTASPEEIMAADVSAAALEALSKETGVKTGTNKETAAFADVLFLAVKPQFFEGMLKDIAPALTPESVVVSIAPGKTIDWIRGTLGCPCRLIRTMPNTPALVGEGMMGICPDENVTPEEVQMVRDICESFARTEVVPEKLMNVVTGVSGSAPAYVFMMIEAMADGAVADGMPRAQAYRFAAQAVLGSAKMVLESGKHPGELKDMVCSPGGTTAEAVRVLEEKGFRSALIEAVKACDLKSSQL